MKYALQLYSVRDYAQNDFFDTLSKVKNMGYDGVEFAGLYEKPKEHIKKHLDKINLRAISAHIDILSLSDENIIDTIQTYKYLGCEYIVIPYLDSIYCMGNEKYEYMIKLLKKACEIAQKYSIKVMYHNHEFEFTYINKSVNMLDDMYNKVTYPNFKLEPDLAWVKIAGNDPICYLKENYEKIGTIHLHDYDIVNEKIEFRPIGYGCQNIKSILQQCQKNNLEWIIIEQDDPSMNKSSLECAKMSIEYIKSM